MPAALGEQDVVGSYGGAGRHQVDDQTFRDHRDLPGAATEIGEGTIGAISRFVRISVLTLCEYSTLTN